MVLEEFKHHSGNFLIMSKTLAGIVCVRNGDSLDYCWREAVASLLPICDEIILSDCDSTDGTSQAMDILSSSDPRIKICNYLWTNPVGEPGWWPAWMNYARHHARSEWICFLDADEVLHEESQAEVRSAADAGRALFCHRLNFWRDAQHLIPEGHCIGHKVLRVGPQNLWMPTDVGDAKGRDLELASMAQESSVKIMHYGFLRKREAFFVKNREVSRILIGNTDARVDQAEKFEGNWMTMPGINDWQNNLTEYRGSHPSVIHHWLQERGCHI